MKILLTGGAGYIGSHTAVELLSRGHQVVIADNFCNSHVCVLNRLKQITGVEIPCCQIDIADPCAVGKVFQQQQIDAVVHFAGLKAVGESVSHPLPYYRNNLDATLTLLEQMKKHHVTRIIFSSSATVYGMARSLPLTEESEADWCSNPYGWTKLMSEQILKDAAAADPVLSVLLLRYFNPVGAHPSGLIGECPNGVPNNLFPYITQVAAGKLPCLSVFGDDYPTPDGTGIRDYIHVSDLALGHVAAVEYSLNHTGVEVFNLGSGTGYSVLEMVHAFERVNQVRIPWRIVPRRPGDIAICYADISKAGKVLDWHPKRTLEDMCRDSWRWQINNPEGYAG